MSHQPSFERGSSYDQHQRKYHSHYLIRCSKCSEQGEIRFNRYHGALPPDLIAKKFQEKNWVIGATRKNDVCPACVKKLVDDRQDRKEASVKERKRASVDAVIAEAKVPTPTHPLISDTELSRRQMILLDRSADLHRQSAYISSALEGLLDRVAELEKQNIEVLREIATLGGEPTHTEVTPTFQLDMEMFERIKVQTHNSLAGPAVHVAHYTTTKATIITLSDALAKQVGVDEESYVVVSQGDDDDEGIIKIELAPKGDPGAFKVWREKTSSGHTKVPTGPIRITIRAIKPKWPVAIPAVDCRFRVMSDGLYVRLPAAFTAQPLTADRSVLIAAGAVS